MKVPGAQPRARRMRFDGYDPPDPAVIQARLVSMGLVSYVVDGVVRSRIRVDHKRFVELEGVEVERMHELVADDERTARVDAPSPLRWLGPFSLEGVRNERELGAQLAELWARASRGLRARLGEARALLPSLTLDRGRGAFVATHHVEGRAVELVLDATLEHAVPSSLEGQPLPEALTIALPLDALFVERLVGLVRTRASSLSSPLRESDPSTSGRPRVAPLGEGTQLADEALLVEAPIEFEASAPPVEASSPPSPAFTAPPAYTPAQGPAAASGPPMPSGPLAPAYAAPLAPAYAAPLAPAYAAPLAPAYTAPLAPAYTAPFEPAGARSGDLARATSEPGRSAAARAASGPSGPVAPASGRMPTGPLSSGPPSSGSLAFTSSPAPAGATPRPDLGTRGASFVTAPGFPPSARPSPSSPSPFAGTTPRPDVRASAERDAVLSSDPFGRLTSPVRGVTMSARTPPASPFAARARGVDVVPDKLGPFDDPFVDHGRSLAPASPVLVFGEDAGELRVDRVDRLLVDLPATLGLGPTRVGVRVPTRVGVRVLNLSAEGLFVSAAFGALPEVGATVELLREGVRPIRARVAHKRSTDGRIEHAGLALLPAAERALPTQIVHVLVAMPDSAMRRLASDLVVRNEMLPLPVDDLLGAVHALHVFPVSLVLLAPGFGGHDAERVVESLQLDRAPCTVLLLGAKGTQRPGLRLVDPVTLGDVLARHNARAPR